MAQLLAKHDADWAAGSKRRVDATAHFDAHIPGGRRAGRSASKLSSPGTMGSDNRSQTVAVANCNNVLAALASYRHLEIDSKQNDSTWP